ncbi:MAG: rhomboid family intramembrane serine protease [Gemmataceae bacterium]
MGINDRDYYRREAPSFLGSFDDQGKACLWLIGLNITCFVLQLLTMGRHGNDGPFTNGLLLDADLVFQGQVWRLLTSVFLHDNNSVWHIVINMLMLWWFGRQVEEHLGTREFLTMYLTAGVLASLAFCLTYALGFNGSRALGASGAVAAVLMLSACYFPGQIIYLFFVIPVPVWFILVLMIASDGFNLLSGRMRPSGGGVASAAHLGGLLFGYLYHRGQWRILRWLPASLTTRRVQPQLRLFNPDSQDSVRPAPRRATNEHLEAQMDAILEKIARVGMAGLTDKEREILNKASEEIRRRQT